MKSPLAAGQIFHHLVRQVEIQIFLCLRAYHLLVADGSVLRIRTASTPEPQHR